jgi:hypothetical protein
LIFVGSGGSNKDQYVCPLLKLLIPKLGKVVKILQLLNLYCRKMPVYRERYADDWNEIALAAKAATHWRNY